MQKSKAEVSQVKLTRWHGMSRQRMLPFHLVNGRTRSGKLARNGECERATVLVYQVAGNVRIETISDLD